MDLGLEGRACIVTGASRGIGLATSRMLCEEGARVLMAARGGDALEEAARACGENAETLAIDVTAPDSGERLVEECERRLGGLDVVVCNAGTSAVKGIDDLTDQDWQIQWELNVLGPMRLMRAACPRMAERGWGRVVNVASSSGKRPSQTNAAYSVTKAGQLSLSRFFADAWAARGVLVNAVTPGPIETGLWMDQGGLADQQAAAKGISREEALEAAASKLPLGRLGTEDEIAAVIVFLCSERASNVVGSAWSADGGAVPLIL